MTSHPVLGLRVGPYFVIPVMKRAPASSSPEKDFKETVSSGTFQNIACIELSVAHDRLSLIRCAYFK